MSISYGKLCSVILKQVFGKNVQSVADCLFDSISRSLSVIVKSTNLSRREATNALAILIKFRLVTFAPSVSGTIPEYSLERDAINYILRYPRYVHLAQAKYGENGSAIVEELVRSGCLPASCVIIKCLNSYDNKVKPEHYRDVFNNMVSDNYLIRLPVPKNKDDSENTSEVCPALSLEDYEAFLAPEVDLMELMNVQTGNIPHCRDKDVYWQINFQRFHQDFRDQVMISAIEKKLGSSAGECFKYILKTMYTKTHPWQQSYSNPFTMAEVKHLIDKSSKNLELMKYLDQYMSLIAEDSLGFIRKTGDMGGGQFVVDFEKSFEELAFNTVESIITEKFGSKASRIFRVIKMKKYIEQEEIQKEAMIPAKEAKLLAYSLLQEQFIQIKTIRKAGGGGAGPAKAFYLFQLKLRQIVKMLLDICFKSLYNAISRTDFEKNENKRLIDKSQKLESIVDAMKERGDAEEFIDEIRETMTPPEREILDKVKTRLKTLANAELALDETIFLFQMYLFHTAYKPPIKTK